MTEDPDFEEMPQLAPLHEEPARDAEIEEFPMPQLSVAVEDDIPGAHIMGTVDPSCHQKSRRISGDIVAALHAGLEKNGQLGDSFDPSEYLPPTFEKDASEYSFTELVTVPAEESIFGFDIDDHQSFHKAVGLTHAEAEAFDSLENQLEVHLREKKSEESYSTLPLSCDIPSEELIGHHKNVHVQENSTVDSNHEPTREEETPDSDQDEEILDTPPVLTTQVINNNEDEKSSKVKSESPKNLKDDHTIKDTEEPCCSKSLKIGSEKFISPDKGKENEASPRFKVYSKSSKRLFQDERAVLEKLGGNKLLVNGSTIIMRDYENYKTEMDVQIPMDENWRMSPMPKLPKLRYSKCAEPYCRLGCVCDSLQQETPIRRHCGKPKCFFECSCLESMLMNGEDGDIRSRLRPRVSLLNWRFAESSEKERETMMNYKLLESGPLFRIRRAALPPHRLRDAFITDTKMKKIIWGENSSSKVQKERLKTIHGKIIIAEKRRSKILARTESTASRGKISSSLRSASKPGSLETKGLDEISSRFRPRTNPKSDTSNSPTPDSTPSKKMLSVVPLRPLVEKEPIPDEDGVIVPEVVRRACKELQLFCLPNGRVLLYAWACHVSHPKIIQYSENPKYMYSLPFLYMPITSFGHKWLFVSTPRDLDDSTYYYLGAIGSYIPSKALLMNMNSVLVHKKTVRLEINWSTSDNNNKVHRPCYIYLLPELPEAMIIGPTPNHIVNYTEQDSKLMWAASYIESITHSRFMGDGESWEHFFSKSQRHPNAYNQNFPADPIDRSCETVKPETMDELIPDLVNATVSPPRKIRKVEATHLTWRDAKKLIDKRQSEPSRPSRQFTLDQLLPKYGLTDSKFMNSNNSVTNNSIANDSNPTSSVSSPCSSVNGQPTEDLMSTLDVEESGNGSSQLPEIKKEETSDESLRLNTLGSSSSPIMQRKITATMGHEPLENSIDILTAAEIERINASTLECDKQLEYAGSTTEDSSIEDYIDPSEIPDLDLEVVEYNGQFADHLYDVQRKTQRQIMPKATPASCRKKLSFDTFEYNPEFPDCYLDYEIQDNIEDFKDYEYINGDFMNMQMMQMDDCTYEYDEQTNTKCLAINEFAETADDRHENEGECDFELDVENDLYEEECENSSSDSTSGSEGSSTDSSGSEEEESEVYNEDEDPDYVLENDDCFNRTGSPSSGDTSPQMEEVVEMEVEESPEDVTMTNVNTDDDVEEVELDESCHMGEEEAPVMIKVVKTTSINEPGSLKDKASDLCEDNASIQEENDVKKVSDEVHVNNVEYVKQPNHQNQ